MRIAAASLVLTAAVAVTTSAGALPRETPPRKPPAVTPKPVKLRIVEVSVFNDGHVLVRQEGTAAPDARGEVVLEGFPAPVYGGYLPYSASAGARLAGVIASVVTTPTSRQAGHLNELLAVNTGSRVRIIETNGERYEGVIEGAPVAVSAAAARGNAPAGLLPGPSAIPVLKTAAGKRLVALHQIRSLTLAGPFTRRIAETELTLKREETIVMPLREMKLDYADVYTVDIPFLPQEDPERSRGLTPE